MKLRHFLPLSLSLLPLFANAAAPLNRTLSTGEYHKPEETARMMKLPEGFQAKVFIGEPDLIQPIAFTIDARGRLWVVENLSYPEWVKGEGKDRIVILEDKDGDGKYDCKKTFWDKGGFLSGIEVGFGGVWVGACPELLFIPDANGDDIPDSEPQVLLDGWVGNDTHETLNSFIWGPDGWLYGCQGVFNRSKVGKPGAPDSERIPTSAAVWRYHPTRHTYEIFAEGGSNQWGVDFNDFGEAFITACVIPHIYHVSLGGRYKRQAGQHNNPHTYFDIQTIRTHKHFAAAFSGCMVYLGDQFPPQFRNQVFMNNIHANKVHVDWISRKGSGYSAAFGPHDAEVEAGDPNRGKGWLDSGDKWYRGIYLRTGPDGSVFVNDWYDTRPCHQLQPHDQDLNFNTGRIYKISYGEPKAVSGLDLSQQSDETLIDLQLHQNDWYVRTARRILQERSTAAKLHPATRERLFQTLRSHADPTRRIRALWSLHVTGGLDSVHQRIALEDPNEHIRAWAVQSITEGGIIDDANLAKFVGFAAKDPSQVVRLHLASAAGRIPEGQRWDLLANLLSHEEDAEDANLPQLYWYALEPLCKADSKRALQLALAGKHPQLRKYAAQRIAAK
jgi:putative membrane-bound dehydrogenase-like protein